MGFWDSLFNSRPGFDDISESWTDSQVINKIKSLLDQIGEIPSQGPDIVSFVERYGLKTYALIIATVIEGDLHREYQDTHQYSMAREQYIREELDGMKSALDAGGGGPYRRLLENFVKKFPEAYYKDAMSEEPLYPSDYKGGPFTIISNVQWAAFSHPKWHDLGVAVKLRVLVLDYFMRFHSDLKQEDRYLLFGLIIKCGENNSAIQIQMLKNHPAFRRRLRLNPIEGFEAYLVAITLNKDLIYYNNQIPLRRFEKPKIENYPTDVLQFAGRLFKQIILFEDGEEWFLFYGIHSDDPQFIRPFIVPRINSVTLQLIKEIPQKIPGIWPAKRILKAPTQYIYQMFTRGNSCWITNVSGTDQLLIKDNMAEFGQDEMISRFFSKEEVAAVAGFPS